MRVLYPGRIGIWSVGSCGKRETDVPGENARNKPTYGTGPESNPGQATMMGSERSHHCAIAAPNFNVHDLRSFVRVLLAVLLRGLESRSGLSFAAHK